MTWFAILLLAIGFTVFALWRFNLLLSIVASAGWFAFLAYHVAYQPTNIIAGDTVDTFIIWAVCIIAIAIPLITIIRMRGRTERGIGGVEGDEKRTLSSNSTVSSMNTDEYRAYIRRRIRRRR